MIFYFFALASLYNAPRAPARLPFSQSQFSFEDYDPVVLSFTEKEVKRCIEALDWYIESFSDEMHRRGLGEEGARYEDLMYRFMGTPDNKLHVQGRKEDRRS